MSSWIVGLVPLAIEVSGLKVLLCSEFKARNYKIDSIPFVTGSGLDDDGRDMAGVPMLGVPIGSGVVDSAGGEFGSNSVELLVS